METIYNTKVLVSPTLYDTYTIHDLIYVTTNPTFLFMLVEREKGAKGVLFIRIFRHQASICSYSLASKHVLS